MPFPRYPVPVVQQTLHKWFFVLYQTFITKLSNLWLKMTVWLSSYGGRGHIEVSYLVLLVRENESNGMR